MLFFVLCARACVCVCVCVCLFVSFLSFVLRECCHTVCCFQSFMPASVHKLGMYLTSSAYIYIFINQSSRCTVIFESYISIYRIIYLSCFCVCSSSSCGCVLLTQKTGSPQQKPHSCQSFFFFFFFFFLGGGGGVLFVPLPASLSPLWEIQDHLTWVRLQQLQEQHYPLLPVCAAFFFVHNQWHMADSVWYFL